MSNRSRVLLAQVLLFAAVLTPRAGIGAVTVAGDSSIFNGVLTVGSTSAGSASAVSPGPDPVGQLWGFPPGRAR